MERPPYDSQNGKANPRAILKTGRRTTVLGLLKVAPPSRCEWASIIDGGSCPSCPSAGRRHKGPTTRRRYAVCAEFVCGTAQCLYLAVPLGNSGSIYGRPSSASGTEPLQGGDH